MALLPGKQEPYATYDLRRNGVCCRTMGGANHYFPWSANQNRLNYGMDSSTYLGKFALWFSNRSGVRKFAWGRVSYDVLNVSADEVRLESREVAEGVIIWRRVSE
jgi:hypothetical protein